MAEAIVGALLFAMGLFVGGGAMWIWERWRDRERMELYQELGRVHQALKDATAIPAEEL